MSDVTTIPTWLAAVGVVVPALTAAASALGGYLLAGRNEQARDERAAERETTARLATVSDRRDEQRHAFQRETLLELQDVLQKQVRTSSRIIMHDRETLKEHGTLTLLGDELDQESYDIGVAVRRLQERVLDAELRDTVERLRVRVAVAGTGVAGPTQPTIDDLEQRFRDLSDEYTAVSEAVGSALRAELGWMPNPAEQRRA